MGLFSVTDIARILIDGLLYGGILSLLAVGLTLIFGVSRVMNIAHGDFLFLGGVVVAVLFANYKLNPLLSILVVVPMFAGIGVLFSLLMRKPLSARNPELGLAATVLVTLGLSNLIETLSIRIAPIYGYNFFNVPMALGTTNFVGVILDNLLLVSFITIVIISIAMSFLVYRTSFGGLMRASMADREVAIMLGADTNRVSMITFAIGIALAAIAGSIEVVISTLDGNVGLPLTIGALTVVILGGLGSFYGALLGGFLIGFLSSLVELILDELGQSGGEWAIAVPPIILLIVLIVKPTGLFKR